MSQEGQFKIDRLYPRSTNRTSQLDYGGRLIVAAHVVASRKSLCASASLFADN